MRGTPNLESLTDANDHPRTRTADALGQAMEASYDKAGNNGNGNKVGFEYGGRNLKTADNKSLGAITRYTPAAAWTRPPTESRRRRTTPTT